jgi:pre-rRNA-processing protein IPI3
VHQRSFCPEPIKALACSPDGSLCAGGGASGALHLWDAHSGRLLRSWPAHFRAVSCLAFDDTGAVLVAGGEDGVVTAWLVAEVADLMAGTRFGGVGGMGGAGGGGARPLRSWADHTLPVTAVVVGAGVGGPLVASASADRTVKLRALRRGGQLLRRLVIFLYKYIFIFIYFFK